MAKETASRDGCCVPTDALCGIIRSFVDDWNRDRPPTGGRFAALGERAEIGPVEALAWLSAESGVSAFTLEKIRQATAENIKKGRRSPLTEFSLADRIVTALDRLEVFHDGEPPTLPVFPYCHATKDAQVGYGGDVSSEERWSLFQDGRTGLVAIESRLELPAGSLTASLAQ